MTSLAFCVSLLRNQLLTCDPHSPPAMRLTLSLVLYALMFAWLLKSRANFSTQEINFFAEQLFLIGYSGCLCSKAAVLEEGTEK